MQFYNRLTFSDSNAQHLKLVKLDDERAFGIWNSGSSAKGIILSGKNNYLTKTPEKTTASGLPGSNSFTRYINGILLDTDKIVICYQKTDGAMYAKVITTTDDDIQLGTEQQINTQAADTTDFEIYLTKLSTTKVAFMYKLRQSAGNYHVCQKVATISGTVFTFGTEDVLVTAATEASTYRGFNISKLATDKIIYTYVKSDTIRYVQARTISGTTLGAVGTELAISDASTSTGEPDFHYVSDDRVYFTGNKNSATYLDVYTASATTLTQASQNLVPLGTTYSGYTGVASMDGDDFLLSLSKTGGISSVTNAVAHVNYSGSGNVSVISIEEFTTPASKGLELWATGITASQGILAYIDTSSIVTYILSSPPIYAVENKRNVDGDLLVSWKKDFRPDIVFFTIGVSTIGGNDIIKAAEASDSQWNQYLYYNESPYLMHLDWEHSLNLPIGGISMGMASGRLNNTSNRFTPRYMGGNSELFTAVLPRRPFIINAGFEAETYPQFVGLFERQPLVDVRGRTLDFMGKDFINFLQNRFVDDETMFTGQRSDQLIETILTDLGFTTAQYELDIGINPIPFAIFERGERFGNIIDRIVKAEYGHFYQDETGKLRFENRQHWDASPHDEVQWALHTSQVIDAEAPDEDHIINVVEVRAKAREKQSEQLIFRLNTLDAIEVPASGTKEVFIDFEDPVLSLTTPSSSSTTSFFKANTLSDGSGTDISSSVTITKVDLFSKAAKIFFRNTNTATAFVTELNVTGRPAKVVSDIYYRDQDDSSVTAFEERPYVIENDYIQDATWAQSFARLVIDDFAEPERLQRVTIRAIPQVKLGDLLTWQGRTWRVFAKKNNLNPSVGFVQELLLLQRTITTYFRIGISTIGSTDRIAP